jgi:hypothetical protein
MVVCVAFRVVPERANKPHDHSATFASAVTVGSLVAFFVLQDLSSALLIMRLLRCVRVLVTAMTRSAALSGVIQQGVTKKLNKIEVTCASAHVLCSICVAR